MGDKDGLTRKEFLSSFGKGLLGAAVAGVAVGATNRAEAAPPAPKNSDPFVLTLAGKLDPALEKPLGVAVDAGDRIYVAGVAGVRVLDAEGKTLREIKTASPAVAVALDREGNLYVAQRTRIEKFDAVGRLIHGFGDKAGDPGKLSYATGIAANDEFVYVTDSGARKVLRYGAADGDFASELAGPAEDEGQKFIIPSAYFDCKLDAQGILHVGHTGMHRIERYDKNMKLVGHWGTFSSTREGFCGCCNPTNIALFPDGRVATTEKGVPRLKVYSHDGKLLACLNETEFPGNTAGMALAVDAKGRIVLAEPVTKEIRFYRLETNKA